MLPTFEPPKIPTWGGKKSPKFPTRTYISYVHFNPQYAPIRPPNLGIKIFKGRNTLFTFEPPRTLIRDRKNPQKIPHIPTPLTHISTPSTPPYDPSFRRYNFLNTFMNPERRKPYPIFDPLLRPHGRRQNFRKKSQKYPKLHPSFRGTTRPKTCFHSPKNSNVLRRFVAKKMCNCELSRRGPLFRVTELS